MAILLGFTCENIAALILLKQWVLNHLVVSRERWRELRISIHIPQSQELELIVKHSEAIGIKGYFQTNTHRHRDTQTHRHTDTHTHIHTYIWIYQKVGLYQRNMVCCQPNMADFERNSGDSTTICPHKHTCIYVMYHVCAGNYLWLL